MFCSGDELADRPLIAPYSSGVIRHVANKVPGSIARAGSLITAAIVHWDTVYLDRAVWCIRREVANRIIISYQGS